MRDRASGVYRLSIRALPVIFVTGFGIGMVGAYLRNRSVINAGCALFLFGGAMWGLVNGGFLAFLYVSAERKLGRQEFTKDFAANPLKSALFIFFTLFLLAAGTGLLYAAWKIASAR